ncbi:ribonuclease H-like domain-containing protein [Tanacetum coccineum]
MWLFRHKYLADGSLSRYKARLMENGSTQLEGINVDETFSPVVKLGTIHTVLSLATSRHWPVHQLDVKNAFLHGDLSETIKGTDTAYLLLYVDEIVLIASFERLLRHIIRSLHQEFFMTDLGALNYFLGSLQYLTFTRPDISYAVQQILQLFSTSTTDLVAFLDADWAGCPTTKRSTSGYRVFLGKNILSWSSKHQPTLSRSSAKAKYRGVANAVAETCWLRNLLRELYTPLSSATLVYCDNVIAVYLSSNPVRVLHVPSRYQYADIFTKGLPTALFEEFCSSLSVRCPPAQTVGECKSQSEHIDEFHKLVGDLAAIDTAISDEDQALLLLTSLPSSYDNFIETLLYGRDILKLEDVLGSLNSRELQKMTEAKGDGGEGLYVRGRSGQRDMKQGTDSAWSKYNHKKSQGFVKNKDQVSGSGADGYDSDDVMMAMSVEELFDWIMDSGSSYHITYMRDYLVDFEEYDGGTRYSLKDKNEAKNDKTKHKNGENVKAEKSK